MLQINYKSHLEPLSSCRPQRVAKTLHRICADPRRTVCSFTTSRKTCRPTNPQDKHVSCLCVCGILLSSCRWLGWVNRFSVAHAQDRQEKGVVWLQYNYGHMGRQIERKIATATVVARWHLRAKIGSRLAELRSTNEVLYKFACSCCCWWQWREKLRTEAKAAQNSTLRSALSLPPFLPLSPPLSLLPLVTLGVLCLCDASV